MISGIFFIKDTGKIVSFVTLPEEEVKRNVEQSENVDWIETNYEPNILSSLVIDGEIVDFGLPPNPYCNLSQHGWVYDENLMQIAKKHAKEKINAERDKEISSGFEAFGKVFDSDKESITKLLTTVSAIQYAPDEFSIDWTCKDNSQVKLTKSMVLQLPLIMVQAGDAIHKKALNLKAKIDSSETFDEIQSISWQ